MATLRNLQTTGYSSNRIDMVFMGDGYTASEIGTTYAAQVQGLLGYMFNGSLLSEPFARYRNFVNIHSIDVVSEESGADDPANGIVRNTALDAVYNGRALSVSLGKADAVEASALPYGVTSEMRFILVNSETYGGAGFDSGIYSAGNPEAYEIALHEIGHAFAGLGDEYDYGAPGPYSGAEPAYANVTTDPSGAKWSNWLGYNQPGIGVIGAYEGAYYHADGIYRPSVNSKMKVLGNPFDAISREQFIRKFYEFVDPLDGYTDPWQTKHNLTDFYVDTIDPSVIKVDWTLDGKTFVNAGETFELDQDHYGFGTHTLTARAYDPTDWVRGDRSALEQSVSWTVVNDRLLTGGSGADRLEGNEKPNEIQGRNGNDTLNGGAGADTLIGGSGNDTYYVDSLDTVVETSGGGTDIVYTGVSYALGDNIEILTALGSAGISLTGTASANKLHGNAGRNTLKGGAGNDKLNGGVGNDTLWGEKGKDIFVFDSKLGTSSTDRKVNFDKIAEFSVKDDSIYLDNAIFKKLSKKGTEDKPANLSKSFFTIGDKAKDKNDTIIYNNKTGVLSYDADGSGKGKAIEFAQLSKNLKMTEKDFFVI